MGEIAQDGEGFFDDVMGLAPLDVHDESHTACVVFKGRIIQTLFL